MSLLALAKSIGDPCLFVTCSQKNHSAEAFISDRLLNPIFSRPFLVLLCRIQYCILLWESLGTLLVGRLIRCLGGHLLEHLIESHLRRKIPFANSPDL